MLAIDDAQWLDSASARALRYALRRFEAEPVGVLATMRLWPGPAIRFPRPPPSRRRSYELLDLGPLTLGALRRVLADTVPRHLATAAPPDPRGVGGQPLYAIELARGLATNGRASRLTEGLPLPDSLQAAITRRLETVPPEVAPVLEIVSALGTTSVGELAGICTASHVEELLPVAEQLGLLVVDDALRSPLLSPTRRLRRCIRG